MKLWLSVAAVTVISWLLKASAPLAIGGRKLPPAVIRVTTLIAPVLIAALIVTELGGKGIDWTQIGGVGAAGVLRLAKVPMLPAIAGGIAFTALIRLI